MSNFIVKCNQCNGEIDVKTKARLDKIKKQSYLCKICIIENKSRICPKCNGKILYQSPYSKRQAEVKNSICKKCCSNQIPNIFTDNQKEFIDGLLLGDASIVYPSKNSIYPRLTLSRKAEDKDYLFWQYDVFRDFYTDTGPTPKNFFDYRTGKTYFQYHLQSKSGEVFTEYYKKWYPNKKKIIPRDLKLTPTTLLVWFLDDGTIIRVSDANLTLWLATNGFCEEDVRFLGEALQAYFGQGFHVYGNSNRGYKIKCSTESTLKFIKAIDPVFPNCMKRKRTWEWRPTN